jgi:hypothetical protein
MPHIEWPQLWAVTCCKTLMSKTLTSMHSMTWHYQLRTHNKKQFSHALNKHAYTELLFKAILAREGDIRLGSCSVAGKWGSLRHGEYVLSTASVSILSINILQGRDVSTDWWFLWSNDRSTRAASSQINTITSWYIPSAPPTLCDLIQSRMTCPICVWHALMHSDTCSTSLNCFNVLRTSLHYIVPLQLLSPCLGHHWGHSTCLPHIVTTCVGPTCGKFPFQTLCSAFVI